MSALITKFAAYIIAALACLLLLAVAAGTWQKWRFQASQAQAQQTAAALTAKTAEAESLQSQLATERARMAALQAQSAAMQNQIQAAKTQWAGVQKSLTEVFKNDQTAKEWGNQPVPTGVGRVLNPAN